MKVSTNFAFLTVLFCLGLFSEISLSGQPSQPSQPSNTSVLSQKVKPKVVGYKKIFGTVLNKVSGKPVKNAKIVVYHRIVDVLPNGTASLRKQTEFYDYGCKIKTNKKGRFSITVPLIEGENIFVVQATKRDYEVNTNSLVQPNLQSEVNFELTPIALDANDRKILEAKEDEVISKKNDSKQIDPQQVEPDANGSKSLLSLNNACTYSTPSQIYVKNLHDGYNTYSCNGSGFTGNMDMDEFISGVVGGEMGTGTNFPIEAKKSQAITARTYAIWRSLSSPYAGNCGMAYSGNSCSTCTTAANSTTGEVITYNDNIIQGLFSARCNGQYTQNANEGTYTATSNCNLSGNSLAYCVCRPCSGHSNCNTAGETPCCNVSNSCAGSGYIYGHGVGYCQRGAQGFANNGSDYCTILNNFFTNVCVANSTPCGGGGLAEPNLKKSTDNISISGNVATFSVTVQNNGNANAGAFRVGFYASTSPTFANFPTLIGSSNISSLNQGSTSAINKVIDLCGAGLSNGTYYVGYFIDDLLQVSESNETDNGYYIWGNTPITISCGTALPNLKASANNLTISGNTANFSVTVQNNGNANASGFRVGFYANTSPTFSNFPTIIGTEVILSLNQNSTNTLNKSIDLCAAGLTTGTYYVGYFIDDLLQVPESNENDNGYDYWGNNPLNISCSGGVPNDDCQNAITLTSNTSCNYTSGSTTGATNSGTLPACPGCVDDDVWYKFTANSAMTTIDVLGSAQFDATFQVLSGSCPSGFSEVVCKDNTSAGQLETATISTTNGQTYYIRVCHHSTGSGSGSFQICVYNQSTPQTYVISTSSNPSNGGGTSGAGTFTSGTQISVTATPNGGWTFVDWKEGATVVSTSSTYSFVVSANRTLVANFSQIPQQFNVALSANPSNGGSVSGSGNYTAGLNATVTATPNSGWTFDNWKEGNTVVSTNQSYTFQVNGNRTLVANFSQAQQQYTITLLANPSNGGSVTGAGSYFSGLDATVLATPNSNWQFVKWTENGTQVSTNSSYTFTVNANRTLIASFTPTVAVSDPTQENSVQIIPNPSNGNFVISTKGGLALKTVEIFNAIGQKALTIQLDKPPYTISEKGLPKGEYWLTITTKNNQIITKKIIIM
jgi:hypothetical protein